MGVCFSSADEARHLRVQDEKRSSSSPPASTRPLNSSSRPPQSPHSSTHAGKKVDATETSDFSEKDEDGGALSTMRVSVLVSPASTAPLSESAATPLSSVSTTGVEDASPAAGAMGSPSDPSPPHHNAANSWSSALAQASTHTRRGRHGSPGSGPPPRARKRAHPSVTAPPRPQGRALQARLEKARSLQAALHSSDARAHPPSSSSPLTLVETPSSPRTTTSSLDLLSAESSFSSTSSTSSPTRNPLLLSPSLRYSLSADASSQSSHRSRSHHHTPMSTSKLTLTQNGGGGNHPGNSSSNSMSNQEFEATVHQGTVWATVERTAPISAVALSQPLPTLHMRSAPLYLAVGAEDGSVTLHALLDDAPMTTSITTTTHHHHHHNNNQHHHPLLGSSTHSVHSASVSTSTKSTASATTTNTSGSHHSATTLAGEGRRLGAPWSIVPARGGRIRCLHFSAAASWLAVGSDDGTCALVSVQALEDEQEEVEEDEPGPSAGRRPVNRSLAVVAQLDRDDRVYCVQFSPDGGYLAVGGFDGTVAIVATDPAVLGLQLATRTGPILPPLEVWTEIPVERGLVYSLSWSVDGRYLAFGGTGKTCWVVDAEQDWAVIRSIARSATIQSVHWYPNPHGHQHHHRGRLAIASSTDIAMVDRNSWKVIHTIQPDSRSKQHQQSNSVKIQALCWSPNGSYLVSCGSDQKCTLYETRTFTPVHEMDRSAPITCVVWGQQSALMGIPRRYMAIGGQDNKVVIVKAGIEINSGASSLGDELSSVASSFMTVGSSSRRSVGPSSVRAGDWVLGSHEFRDVDDTMAQGPSGGFVEEQQRVLAVAFSRGSKSRPSTYFSYSSGDGLVTVRSTVDWKVVAERRFPQAVHALAFSNGSRYLAYGCDDGKLYVSETGPSWTMIATRDLNASVRTVAFSKNNERLAAASLNGSLVILDPLRQYQAALEFERTDSSVLSMDWSSKHCAIGRHDGSVRIYEAEQLFRGICTVQAELQLKGPVRALALGVGSRFLAVGTEEGGLNIYSSKGGWVLCHRLSGGPGGAVVAVRWSPTGHHLAVGTAQGRPRVVDTIFWTHIPEAGRHVPGHSDRSSSPPPHLLSSLAFSQDGKLLSLGWSDHGATVMDSTRQWQVAFTLERRNMLDSLRRTGFSTEEDDDEEEDQAGRDQDSMGESSLE